MICSGTLRSRADLHVHSRYSDRPSEWFLRRIGSPESFVDPRKLYETCRARGMDYVTITDHNSIHGALEIAHLPGTFISSELTTYFPENGCKIHCLVWGITEKNFREMDELRPDIYALHRYLNEQGIAHAVAHPLFRVNDRLTLEQVDKLLLMFKRFEGLNGSRHPRAATVFRAIAASLTPDWIGQLADRYGMEPTGPEPWKKLLTGGSDDHSGLYTAEAHTVTPHAATVFDFLGHLRDGLHQPGGRAGTSVRLAHSLYTIASGYYEDRLRKTSGGKESLAGAFLKRIVGEPGAPQTGFRASLLQPVRRIILEKKKRQLSEIEKMLFEEIAAIRRAPVEPDETDGPEPAGDDRKFKAACRIGHQLAFSFAQRFTEQVRQGSLIESLQSLASLGPVALGMAPYLTAFGVQHKDEVFLRQAAQHFPGIQEHAARSSKRAWFTDTLTDMNGVANTIRTLASMAHREGKQWTVATCLSDPPAVDFPLKNFRPAGVFSVREYQQQQMVFPPVLEILHWLEEEEIEEVFISTPGPVGLAARMAARLLKLRVCGIYHTDFPQYVRHFSDDERLEEITWRYMNWFYDGMERIAVPSQAYLDRLAAHGFERARLFVMPRGVDGRRFNPERRSDDFRKRFGLNSGFTFLYAGRISKEKNLGSLLDAFRLLRDEGESVHLVLAGDGPDLDELRRTYADEKTRFIGRLDAEALAQAYAGADVFVFPSLTDTFGNVVLEAHACGLPAIVSGEGGPGEIVRSHGSGLVVDARSPAVLAEAMRRLQADPVLRQQLSEGALARARSSRWESVLELLQPG